MLVLVLGLHMAASLFWFLSSVILGWNVNLSASGRLFCPQMVAAALAVFSGGGMWQMLHAGGFGRREMVLAAGAVIAVVAAGVQGALVGGPVRRLRSGGQLDGDAGKRILLGQRIAAGLLLVTFACMMAERYV